MSPRKPVEETSLRTLAMVHDRPEKLSPPRRPKMRMASFRHRAHMKRLRKAVANTSFGFSAAVRASDLRQLLADFERVGEALLTADHFWPKGQLRVLEVSEAAKSLRAVKKKT